MSTDKRNTEEGGVFVLRDLIESRVADFSRTERLVANYLLTHPEALMIETGGVLAVKAGVSEMTISRFVRKLGFDSHAAARDAIRKSIMEPSSDQGMSADERFRRFMSGGGSAIDDSDRLDLELISIQKVHEMANLPVWSDVAKLLAEANSVFVIGFQTSQHIARGFARQLEIIRPGVQFIDGQDGTYIAPFSDPSKKKVLFLVDTYRYAENAPSLCMNAVDAGIDVVVLTDEYCHWAIDVTSNVLPVMTNTSQVFPSMAGLSAATGLLVQSILDELGSKAETQIEKNAKLQGKFKAYMSFPSKLKTPQN